AYFTSRSFRAISSATSASEPSILFVSGPARGQVSQIMGLVPPDDPRWKQLSPGMNGRADLPPLLWQSGDGEANINVESWTRLRQAGAQVEWLQYPGEGHSRTQPAHIWWVYERNVDWFRFWLKDEEDPDPRKLDQYKRWSAMRENLKRAR